VRSLFRRPVTYTCLGDPSSLGQVEEIADFVVFLLSDRSGVVTGSVIDWDQNVLGGLD
jgi:NAD(P)-dependent dehydrogenase (short-subunit alcohol dehydrogenase family)